VKNTGLRRVKGGRLVKKSSSNKRYSNPKKGGIRRMARGNIQATFFKIARIGSLVAPVAIYASQRSGSMTNKVARGIMALGGINTSDKFDAKLLMQMWLPFISTSALTSIIPRLNGIIKRLTRF